MSYKSTRLLIEAINREIEDIRKHLMSADPEALTSEGEALRRKAKVARATRDEDVDALRRYTNDTALGKVETIEASDNDDAEDEPDYLDPDLGGEQ